MTNAYRYLIKAGGLEEESSYPYTGKPGECKFDPEKVAVKVVNFTNIPIDENQIAANLVHHGPLAGKFVQWDHMAITLILLFSFSLEWHADIGSIALFLHGSFLNQRQQGRMTFE